MSILVVPKEEVAVVLRGDLNMSGAVSTQSVQATWKGIELTLHASSVRGRLADPAENERNSPLGSFALPRGRKGGLTRAIASKISPRAAPFLMVCLLGATCWAN